MNRFNYERAAYILAEAALSKDRLVADQHGVSVRSIEDWRRKLRTDPKLQQEYRRLIDARTWQAKVPQALAAATAYIERAAQTPEITPELITAISTAITTLNEVMLVQASLDARKAQYDYIQN